MPDIVSAGHLFRLLHQRQRPAEIAFTVQHFAVYRRGDDPAVEISQRQFIQGDHRQAFGFFRVAVVNRDLRTQGVKFAVQRGIHFAFHLLLGTRQQHVHFAVAVLALHQPGLQKYQTRIFQQAFPGQRAQRLFKQRQLAMVKQAPRVVEQNIAQHIGVARGQRMMDGFTREALRHPAFCG
ncbi:hypothetical protein D3C78_488870 [compost metagenome]